MRVYILETQKVLEQRRNKWNMVECNGIAKKYMQVSENESEKSEEADGRKRLRRQVSQRADDVRGMTNSDKRKLTPKKRKEYGQIVTVVNTGCLLKLVH